MDPRNKGTVLSHLDNLDSYGLLDHFIQICLFGWPVIVTWICEPEISEGYFFLGHPVCKKGWEDLENGEVVGLNWGVAGHLKIMIITITNIICVQLKLTEQMPKLNLLAYLP